MEVKDKTKPKAKRVPKDGMRLGRPMGSGKFGETTTAIRVPSRLTNQVKEWVFAVLKEPSLNPIEELIQNINKTGKTKSVEVGKLTTSSNTQLPLYGNKVPAGFPSPGDDHLEKKLDLNDYVVKNPATTFYVRVVGDSMLGAGIHEDDILVVDRSLTAADGKIVIAVLNGEMTVKRLKLDGKGCYLVAENEDYTPIEIKEDNDFLVWGVVTHVIHSV